MRVCIDISNLRELDEPGSRSKQDENIVTIDKRNRALYFKKALCEKYGLKGGDTFTLREWPGEGIVLDPKGHRFTFSDNSGGCTIRAKNAVEYIYKLFGVRSFIFEWRESYSLLKPQKETTK